MNIPIELWNRLPEVFEKMDGWLGFVKDGHINEGVIHWFSCEDEEKHIFAHPDYKSFLLDGKMEDSEWKEWVSIFKIKTSKIVGYEVKELE